MIPQAKSKVSASVLLEERQPRTAPGGAEFLRENIMAYRNKVFVSFDGDNDIHYYRLMQAWKQNDRTAFNFFDAHDINTARDTSTEETIKRRLSERLSNARVVASLIGEHTRYLYKFVRWELEQAVSRGIPVIGVNLNGRRSQDMDVCPPVLRDELVAYISFQPVTLQYALENWPAEHARLRPQGMTGPRYYQDDVYARLGL